MAYLAVEGDRRIYYERRNVGGKLPVIFVHGWAMSSRVWDGPMETVREAGHEVLAFDMRGCGHSDKDFDDLSISAIGSDIERLATELGLRELVLNGWSTGGAAIVDAAAKLAGRLRGLVLTGGATPKYLPGEGWAHGTPPDVFATFFPALRSARAPFLDGIARAVCKVDVGEPTIRWMFDIFMQSSSRADLTLRNLGEIDQRGLLPKIDVPVLIMQGRHDAFVSWEMAQEQTKMLPDNRLVEFPECGHAPFLEDAQRYTDELVKFLKEVEPKRR
ncbi:MAG: alpha/beta hydrolase [Dehalococcoidia bacterium]